MDQNYFASRVYGVLQIHHKYQHKLMTIHTYFNVETDMQNFLSHYIIK